MSEPTLIEFANTHRFKPSRYRCPQCNGEALQDDWPPNYAGGSMTEKGSESGGNIKHVCLHCKISFRVAWWEKTDYSGEQPTIDSGNTKHDIQPLVERDGHLLTPHDVWRYQYHDEHGEWPRESYA